MGGGSGKEIGEWMDLTCCGRVSTDRGETRLPAEPRDALLLPTATHRIYDEVIWLMDDQHTSGSPSQATEAITGFFFPPPEVVPTTASGDFYCARKYPLQ